jgi:hypothetical protein
MGTLKPGATYIYERVNDVVYARESGKSERIPISWEFDPNKPSETVVWSDIKETAKTNPALQKALDNVIMIYRLTKDNPL